MSIFNFFKPIHVIYFLNGEIMYIMNLILIFSSSKKVKKVLKRRKKVFSILRIFGILRISINTLREIEHALRTNQHNLREISHSLRPV